MKYYRSYTIVQKFGICIIFHYLFDLKYSKNQQYYKTVAQFKILVFYLNIFYSCDGKAEF